jgi:hypothetical protein
MRKPELLTFILFGEKIPTLFMKVNKTQGMLWHKDIVPAMRRLIRTLGGYKRKRYGWDKQKTWDIDGVEPELFEQSKAFRKFEFDGKDFIEKI